MITFTDNYLFIATLSFLAGGISGWFLRGGVDRRIKNQDLSTFVAVIVVIAWLASVIFDLGSPDYETSPLMHGIMGLIVGFFFKKK